MKTSNLLGECSLSAIAEHMLSGLGCRYDMDGNNVWLHLA